MPVYVIVEVKIIDPVLYAEVIRLTPPTISAYGGKYLARGGRCETLSGNWQPERLVILEFESSEQVKRWQASPEYSPVKAIRDRAAVVNMVVLEVGAIPD
jgi:uncharacterized protein (DUF1330 family)